MFQIKFVEKLKTHIFSSVTSPLPSPPPENRAVVEIMWKNRVQPERSQMTICALHAGCLSRQTLSEYLMLISLPLQQWLQESA